VFRHGCRICCHSLPLRVCCVLCTLCTGIYTTRRRGLPKAACRARTRTKITFALNKKDRPPGFLMRSVRSTGLQAQFCLCWSLYRVVSVLLLPILLSKRTHARRCRRSAGANRVVAVLSDVLVPLWLIRLHMYHKNRLIKMYARFPLPAATEHGGEGSLGVVEADGLKLTHNSKASDDTHVSYQRFKPACTTEMNTYGRKQRTRKIGKNCVQ